MTNNNALKKEFLKAVSSLIDKHSGKDYELMRKIEDFTWDVFALLDGCRPDDVVVFLTTAAFEKDIISGDLHHGIIRCRLFKNPARREETRATIQKYCEKIREVHQSSSSRSLISSYHSSNSS